MSNAKLPIGTHVYAFGLDKPPYKIGFASNLMARQSQLRKMPRANSPGWTAEGTMIRYWRAGREENAKLVELYLHAIFHKKRDENCNVRYKDGREIGSWCYNEWFAVTIPDIEDAVLLLEKRFGFRPPPTKRPDICDMLVELERWRGNRI